MVGSIWIHTLFTIYRSPSMIGQRKCKRKRTPLSLFTFYHQGTTVSGKEIFAEHKAEACTGFLRSSTGTVIVFFLDPFQCFLIHSDSVINDKNTAKRKFILQSDNYLPLPGSKFNSIGKQVSKNQRHHILIRENSEWLIHFTFDGYFLSTGLKFMYVYGLFNNFFHIQFAGRNICRLHLALYPV